MHDYSEGNLTEQLRLEKKGQNSHQPKIYLCRGCLARILKEAGYAGRDFVKVQYQDPFVRS